MQLKSVVGTTFGFNTGDSEIGDFYFGGYYMASRILPYPTAMRTGIGTGNTVRILGPEDPTFKTLHKVKSSLDEFCGGNIEIVNLPLDELHGEIMKNAARATSRYDLIAVDLPWIGQLATQGIVDPIDDIMLESRHNPSDFHNAAFRGSSWQGR